MKRIKLKSVYRQIFIMILFIMASCGGLIATQSINHISHSHEYIVHAADKGKNDKANKDDDKNNKDSSSSNNSNSSSSSGGSGSQGNYQSLQPSSMLTTAFYDGLSDAKSSSDASKFKTLKNNVNMIMKIQNDRGHQVFSTMGALYGALGLSNSSATSNIVQKESADKNFYNQSYFQNNGTYYHTFGMAYDNLASNAASTNASNLSGSNMVDTFNGLSGIVAGFGIKMLKAINPMPVVLALNNSNTLTDTAYKDNLFVGLINDHPELSGIVHVFGDSSPYAGLSLTNMIEVILIIVGLAISALMILLNGRSFGIAVRRAAIRIAIMALAIPLSAQFFSFGLNTISNLVDSKPSVKDELLNKNLDLGDWAKAARFGVPANMNLQIKDGKFQFQNGQIKAINLYAMNQAGAISDKDYNNGHPSSKVLSQAAEYLKSKASQNKNQTTVNWQDITQQTGQNAGNPYSTANLIKLATALGGNQKISLKPQDLNNIGYLQNAGLITNDGQTYHMDSGIQYGLAPVAAFNILNTNFDNDSLSVSSNLNTPTVPSVAVGVDLYNAASLSRQTGHSSPNGVLLFILNIMMMMTAFKALARIFTSGFGNVLKGGGSSTFGAAPGAGELFGGVITIIFGTIGLSLMILCVQDLVGALWSLMYKAIDSIPGINLLTNSMTSFSTSMAGIPFVGSLLAGLVKSVLDLILTIISLLFLPKFVKVPLEAFGTWAASLPSFFAEKAQQMENRLTGDYRAGGRAGGGNFANAAAKASQKHSAAGRLMKTSALMLGGASIRKGMNKISSMHNNGGSSVANTSNNTDGPTSPDGGPLKSSDDSKSLSSISSSDSKSQAENSQKTDSKNSKTDGGSINNSENSSTKLGDNQSIEGTSGDDAGAVDANGNPISNTDDDAQQAAQDASNVNGDESISGENGNDSSSDINNPNSDAEDADNDVNAADNSDNSDNASESEKAADALAAGAVDASSSVSNQNAGNQQSHQENKNNANNSQSAKNVDSSSSVNQGDNKQGDNKAEQNNSNNNSSNEAKNASNTRQDASQQNSNHKVDAGQSVTNGNNNSTQNNSNSKQNANSQNSQHATNVGGNQSVDNKASVTNAGDKINEASQNNNGNSQSSDGKLNNPSSTTRNKASQLVSAINSRGGNVATSGTSSVKEDTQVNNNKPSNGQAPSAQKPSGVSSPNGVNSNTTNTSANNKSNITGHKDNFNMNNSNGSNADSMHQTTNPIHSSSNVQNNTNNQHINNPQPVNSKVNNVSNNSSNNGSNINNQASKNNNNSNITSHNGGKSFFNSIKRSHRKK